MLPASNAPPDEVLAWWNCGRKARYPTEQDATARMTQRANATDLNVYPCGDHWHIGRVKTSKRPAWRTREKQLWRARDKLRKIEARSRNMAH